MRRSSGTADDGDGGGTKPPRSSRACSRAAVLTSNSCPGVRPMVPMNGEPGMRTPGKVGAVLRGRVPVDLERVRKDVAQKRTPVPGRYSRGGRVRRQGSQPRARRLAPAPLTNTGPVSGCTTSGSARPPFQGSRQDPSGRRMHHASRERPRRLAAQHRRNIRVPAVVTRVRFLQKRLAPVDPDLMGGHCLPCIDLVIVALPAVRW